MYRTIDELHRLVEPSGAKWCVYGVVKFRRLVNPNCMLLGICDPTSYGKGERPSFEVRQMELFFRVGVRGASCLLYRESYAGTIELPVDIEIGQLIRLHRMKVSSLTSGKSRTCVSIV